MNTLFWRIFFIGFISIHVIPSNQTEDIPPQESKSETTSNTNQSSLQSVPPPQAQSSSEHDQDTPSIKTPPPSSSLSCILFQNIGCNIQCVVVEKQRGYETSGSCDTDNFCSCTVQNTSLLDLWKKKFVAVGLTQEIKANTDTKLYDRVMNVFLDPSKTAQQCKEELKKILPEELFERVKLKPIKITGQAAPNEARLLERTNQLLNPLIEKHAQILRSLDYKKSLQEYLKNDKNNPKIQEVFRQIRQVENQPLIQILNQFLADNDGSIAEQTQYETDNSVDTEFKKIVTNIIINRLIHESGFHDNEGPVKSST